MLRAPTINYLLFADNSFIFRKTNIATSNNLLRILHVHAQASGQCINIEKTMIVFSRNVGEKDKIDIVVMWGCKDAK